MNINFLGGKKKENSAFKKQPEQKFAIDYTQGIIKKAPPPAPLKPEVKVEKKEKNSWWKKFKANWQAKKNKPKPVEPKTITLPKAAPITPAPKKQIPVSAPIKPAMAIQVPVPPKPKIKIQQKQEAGVYLPPAMPQVPSATHVLNQKDLEKITKGELASSFLDVNLIPKELADQLRPLTKIRRLIWAGIVSWLIIFIIYGGMLFYQSTLINDVITTQTEIQMVDQEIDSYLPWQKETTELNTKIENISSILNKHVYWTAFFSFLEANTLPEVNYQNLSGDISGTFTLSAFAPNYETIAKQIAIFKNSDLISNVDVSSASLSGTATSESAENTISPVKFNISLTVKPEIFYANKSL